MSKSTVPCLLLCAASGLLAHAPATAADSGQMRTAGQLQAEPYRDAKTILMLAAGDRVDILKRQGGWYQVRSSKGRGWVRMLNVRRGETSKASAETEISGLLSLDSGRAGTGNMVASTGIRGLSEEQLKAAKYSASELKRSDSFVQSVADAREFALRDKLVSRKIEYLPAPSK